MRKILHLASFQGNVGDILNHQGFYSTYGHLFGEYQVTKIEIRDFYASAEKQRRFDDAFADYVNEFDLFIIGGGGFFDAKWTYSHTGTTIDMSEQFIDSIKIPVLINGMGYHENPDMKEYEVYDRFEHFIRSIANRSNWLVTLRNDGSLERITNRYGVIPNVHKVPDSGFLGLQQTKNFNFNNESEYIGLCITNESFSKTYNKEITVEAFNKKIAEVLVELSKRYVIVLFSHTPQDIDVISKLFNYLPSHVKRNRIITTPYTAIGEESLMLLRPYYERCKCIVGMRFHSVIMALQLGLPIIALAGHTQIEALMADLNLTDKCIRVHDDNYPKEIMRQIETSMSASGIEGWKDYVLSLQGQYKQLLIKFLNSQDVNNRTK